MVTITTGADRQIRTMEGIRVVFQKVARIIAGRSIFVKISDPHIEAPGWTDGRDIYLNREHIEQVLGRNPTDKEFGELVLRIKGVIYHELDHILYTPRSESQFVSSIIARARSNGFYWWWAFNALEDQRIETLFTSSYRPAGRYFEAAALEWLVKTPEALSKAHLLVHGRTYLPDAVRAQARSVFAAKYGLTVAQEVEDIIDTYLAVTFPTDGNKAMKCVERFVAVLNQINPTADPNQLPPQPSEDNDPKSAPYGSEDHIIKEGSSSSSAQKDAQAEREKRKTEPKSEDPKPSPKDDEDRPEGNGQETDEDGNVDEGVDHQPGDGSDSDDGDGQQPGDGGAGDADGDGDDEGDASDGSTDASGDGKAATEHGVADDSQPGDGVSSGTSEPGDLADLARELLDQIEGSQELVDDIQSTVDSIRQVIKGEDGLGAAQAPFALTDAPSECKQVVRKCVVALSQLKLDLESEKVHRQLSGQINMRRIIGAQAHEVDVFDRWEEDAEDEGGIEAVVLLDMSGSMSGCMATASDAMWVVKRSLQELGIPTTVLGFSDDWYTLYRPNERVGRQQVRRYGVVGGTTPLGAIQKAHEILTKSQRPNRALITITDGGWSTTDAQVEPFMRSLHSQGTSSLLIGLNTYGYSINEQYGLHHHEHGLDIQHVEDVPLAIQQVVAGIMRKAARNRLHV